VGEGSGARVSGGKGAPLAVAGAHAPGAWKTNTA